MRRKRGLYLTRRAKECDLEEETKTVEQKVLLCEEKMSSVMSSKKSNLDVPVEDVDGCTDRRIAIPYGIRKTAYSDFSGFGEIGGRQGLSSGDMSWAYSRSLSNGSFGYGEVPYRLAFKRPLGKKPLEELSLFAPRKKCREERYGTVSHQSGWRGVQEAPTHPGGSRERGAKEEETEQDEGEG